MLWVWALIHEKCPSPLFLILAHVKSLTLELTIYRIVRPSAKFANEKAHFFLLNKRQLTVSGTSRPRGVNKKAKTFHFDYHFRYCFQIFVFLIFTFVFLVFFGVLFIFKFSYNTSKSNTVVSTDFKTLYYGNFKVIVAC